MITAALCTTPRRGNSPSVQGRTEAGNVEGTHEGTSLGHEEEEAATADGTNGPRGSTPSETSQRQRRTCRTCLKSKNKSSRRENRLVVAGGGTGSEGGQKAQTSTSETGPRDATHTQPGDNRGRHCPARLKAAERADRTPSRRRESNYGGDGC